MTNEEAKIAMFSEHSVMYDDIVFDKILALIFRKNDNDFISSAEILDKANAVYRVPIRRLSLTNESEEAEKEVDLSLQKKLLEVDQQMELVFTIFSSARYEECSTYTNRLLELIIDFSNSLEEKIKEKLNKKEPCNRP